MTRASRVLALALALPALVALGLLPSSVAADQDLAACSKTGPGFTRETFSSSRSVKRGSAGDDRLTGTSGDDKLSGRRGDDRIRGCAGDDDLSGGSGADKLLGDRGIDFVVGGRGGDELNGGPSEDDLIGGDGGDVIDARDGNQDTIDCGPGKDTAIVDDAEDGVFDCERIRFP